MHRCEACQNAVGTVIVTLDGCMPLGDALQVKQQKESLQRIEEVIRDFLLSLPRDAEGRLR